MKIIADKLMQLKIWFSSQSKRRRWSLIALTALGVLVLLVGVPVGAYRTAALLNHTLPADALDAVEVDSAYLADSGNLLIYTDGRVDLGYLRRNLQTTDNQTLRVSRITDRVYSVHLYNLPKPGDIFSLQLRSPRGSSDSREFPVKVDALQPLENLQARMICTGSANNVDIYAPVLLHFSQPVPLGQLQANLEFSEGVKTKLQMVDNVAVIQPRSPLKYSNRYSVSVSSGLKVSGKVLHKAFTSQFMTTSPPSIYSEQLEGIEFEQSTLAPVSPLTIQLLSGGKELEPRGNITLIFSDQVKLETLYSYLTISPKADYTATILDNVAVIQPVAPLALGQSYTLHIREGMESVNGRRLEEDYSTSVRTPDRGLSLTLTNQESNVVDVSKPLVLEFALENRKADYHLIELTLYRMNNYQQYRTVLSLSNIEQDFSLLELSHNTQVLRNGLNSVQLENPGKGIYLVKVEATDPETGLPMKYYKCLNVTDLAVYLQTANNRTTVWVNSTSGTAVQSGLKVELTDRTTYRVLAAGTTAADGSCELTYDTEIPKKLKNNQADGVLTIYNAQGGVLYADTTVSIAPGSKKPGNTLRYYTFFFTDRTLYRPTDNISFWGYIKPYMLNSEPLPKTVRIYLDRDGVDQWVDVPLRADGTFIGEMAIDKLMTSQYSLAACLYYPAEPEESRLRLMDELWLEVKDYEKPTFLLTVQAAKVLFSSPEQVEMQAKLTFYDGTPVPGFPLELDVMNLQEGNMQETKKAFTDDTGTATFRFRPDVGIGRENMPNGPVESYCTVVLDGDGEVLRKQAVYRYQAAGLVADAQSRVTGDQTVEVTLRTNLPGSDVTVPQLEELTASRREYWGGTEASYNQNLYRILSGAPANVGLQGKVKVSYTDSKGGNRAEEFPISAVTHGGLHRQSVQLEVPCDPKYNVGVAVQISCVDDNLNLIASNWEFNTIPPWEAPPEEKPDTIKGYSLSVTRNEQPAPMPVELNYRGYNDLTVDMTDRLTLRLCKDGVPVKNQGRLFYQLIQENPIDQQVITTDSFSLRQVLDYAKSVHLVAAYFDGKTVYPVTDTALRLQMSSVELDIKVTADKQSYRPGETVNLQMRVSDKKGSPLSSNLCVSVVDEALFALREQELNVVDDLYHRVAFEGVFVQKYTTAAGDLIEQYTGADGGKGGGGIEAYDVLREKFKDTAFFYDTRTNAAGAAQLSFKLPDNITSWRVTTVSVGGNLYGGTDKSNIITTLPFFSKPILTSKYLAGDEVVMLNQGHGTLLDKDSEISYQIHLVGNDIDRTITATGTASRPVPISFGQLEAGEYTVSSTAQYADYRDTVVLPLTVIPSNLEMVINRTVDPLKLSELSIARYPVTLTFYDKEHEAFFQSMNSLLAYVCSRNDQRLSRYVAKTAMQRYFPAEQIPRYLSNDDYIGNMQCDDGGIGRYRGPREVSDTMLTVQTLLAVGPDSFNARRMSGYLRGQLVNVGVGNVERAAIYAGLACLEPETVKEIDLLLREQRTMQERLYYLLGLACGGDTEQALQLYERDVAPYLQVVGDGKRMIYHDKAQQDQDLSAQAWLLATKLRHPDADALARHFAKSPWNIDTMFERMVYVNDYRKPVAASAPIRYTLHGLPQELETGAAGQASLLLTREQLLNLQFTSVPENLTTRAYYIGEPSDMEQPPSRDITIAKTVEAREDGSYLTTLQVTLADAAPVGNYDISDWIPSNMRYFGMKESGSGYAEQELQKLYFSFDRHDETDNSFTFSYITRKSFEAAAMLDSTYVIHADSGSYSYTPRRAFP